MTNIVLTNELLNDVYKPSYNKEQFVIDNNLKTEIGKSKFEKLNSTIGFIFSIGLFVFVIRTTSFAKDPFYYLGCLVLILINTYYFFSRKRHNDNDPVIRFEDKELYLKDQFLAWKSIDDWKFVSGGRYTKPKVVLSYYDSHQQLNETTIIPNELNTDYVEILMLLIFYKAQQNQNKSVMTDVVQ